MTAVAAAAATVTVEVATAVAAGAVVATMRLATTAHSGRAEAATERRKKELLGMYVRGRFINLGRKYGIPLTLGLTASSERQPSTTPRCYARTEWTPDNPALLRANGTNRAGVIFMPDCADGCSTPGAELPYA